MAITSAMTSLFAQLPAPLIYGYLYDISCTLFRDQEGEQGDCLQYDIESIANNIVRFSAGMSIVPLLADLALVGAVRKTNLYLEPVKDQQDEIKANDPAAGNMSEEAETSL